MGIPIYHKIAMTMLSLNLARIGNCCHFENMWILEYFSFRRLIVNTYIRCDLNLWSDNVVIGDSG